VWSDCLPVGLVTTAVDDKSSAAVVSNELFNLVKPCVVTSVVGQLEHSCDDLWGPFLHGVEVLKAQFLST